MKSKYAKSNEEERYLLRKAKQRAGLQGREFSIDVSDIVIPNYCPVLGIPLDWSDQQHTPSVDRTDNTKGYVKGNVRVISFRANMLKNDCATGAELRLVADYIDKCRRT